MNSRPNSTIVSPFRPFNHFELSEVGIHLAGETAVDFRLKSHFKLSEGIMSPFRGLLLSVLSAVICLCWSSPSVSGEVAHLILDSQPGSFIGEGMNWDITYTPQNSQSFFTEIVETLPSGQPDYIRFILGTVTSGLNNTYAELDFSTVQLGVPLQAGTYDNAERAAFADPGHPGLDISFQNRGSNTLTGSFTINEVSFYKDMNNVLQIGSLSVSYSQDSDNGSSIITGSFTFQGLGVPEPIERRDARRGRDRLGRRIWPVANQEIGQAFPRRRMTIVSWLGWKGTNAAPGGSSRSNVP